MKRPGTKLFIHCFFFLAFLYNIFYLNESQAVTSSLIEITDELCGDLPLAVEADYYFTEKTKAKDEDQTSCEECGPCPPIYVLSINGVNSDINSPFHNWIQRNTPGGVYHGHDPYNGSNEWCNGDPSKAAENLRQQIEEFKAAHPCAKVVVIGHSLGGIAAWYLRDIADCSLYIDPPTDCYPGGSIFCASQTDICDAVDDGMKDDPGHIPTDEHTPFNDTNANCKDLKKIRSAIDECIQRIRPNCADNDPLDPAPNCEDTKVEGPQLKPQKPSYRITIN